MSVLLYIKVINWYVHFIKNVHTMLELNAIIGTEVKSINLPLNVTKTCFFLTQCSFGEKKTLPSVQLQVQLPKRT